MEIKIKYTYIILLLAINIIYGQTQNIDVQNYINNITVSDSSDTIVCISKMDILFNEDITHFSLDLIAKNQNGKGMTVSNVLENNESVEYTQSSDKLNLSINPAQTGETRSYTIYYSGIPADGLIISMNKYGDRTFFGDNWPNRAKNWFPCVDHPSDRAYITFMVTAPSRYQVVANGRLVEETDLNNGDTFYVWKTNVTIPTKVMTIGIARFAVEHLDEVKNIPISSWVYPQDKVAGFYDYAVARDILEFFVDSIGPYPYQKLANVQSKTRYGGMENASNIFYAESSVTGTRSKEDLIAHEIAHQWFGDSATEIDWPHLWLSEGFAVYFANLYLEQKYGAEFFKDRLDSQRQKVIYFSKQQYTPVVDFETKDYMQLLNPNSYEKGGWVLHMLRKKVGDELFWKSMRTYYDTYKFSNASTDDFRKVFESETKQDLKTFFDQWLYSAGHPELSIEKTNDGNMLKLSIAQKQKSLQAFTFPLDVQLNYSNGSKELKTIQISKRNQIFSIPLKSSLKNVVLDPDTWLLFENVSKD